MAAKNSRIVMNNAYVYRHRRLDTNKIFYIGIGVKSNYKRSLETRSRSVFWHNVNNKTKIRVEVVQDNLTWTEAGELETLLIELYGRSDLGLGPLVNHTDGGGGISNPSPEVRIKMGLGRKGKASIWKDKKLPLSTKIQFSINHADVSNGKNPRARKVLDNTTGEVYGCIKDLADKLGVNHRTLCAKLNNIKGYKSEPNYTLC